MSLPPPVGRVLLAALLLLPLAACDETTGAGADVSVVVDDAVAARQGGRFDQAVTLLRGALDREPDNAEVRVELATTLLQRDGIGLVDLDRVGRFLAGPAEGRRAAASPGARRGSACDLADDPTAETIDPTDFYGFDEIQAKLETLAEADRALSTVIPEALRGFDVCTSVVDGALVYDREGALRELAEQGLSEAQVAQALAVNALTTFLDAYAFVAGELPQQATWYRRADGSIAICLADEGALRAEIEGAVADIGGAVLSLDARAALIGPGSTAAEVVGVALDAYQQLRSAVDDYCDA